MRARTNNIIIVETSEIICEGINSILQDSGRHFNVLTARNLNEVEQINLRAASDLILINPMIIQNQLKEFHSLKRGLPDVGWIGIVYTFFDQELISCFDDCIYINDSANKVISSIRKLLITGNRSEKRNYQQEVLSERESDVLRLLVAGNPNKAIAGKLNISTHTVISHRKSISRKTGIKSVSGLTIYAVINNIISLDDHREGSSL